LAWEEVRELPREEREALREHNRLAREARQKEWKETKEGKEWLATMKQRENADVVSVTEVLSKVPSEAPVKH
jgi:hypothetical protein